MTFGRDRFAHLGNHPPDRRDVKDPFRLPVPVNLVVTTQVGGKLTENTLQWRERSRKHARLRGAGLDPEADPLEEIRKLRDRAASKEQLTGVTVRLESERSARLHHDDELRKEISGLRSQVTALTTVAHDAVRRAVAAEQQLTELAKLAELDARVGRAETLGSNLHHQVRRLRDRQSWYDQVQMVHTETLTRHGFGLADHEQVMADHAERVDEVARQLLEQRHGRRRGIAPDPPIGPAARPAGPEAAAEAAGRVHAGGSPADESAAPEWGPVHTDPAVDPQGPSACA